MRVSPKPLLDRFSCIAYKCDKRTDRRADRPCYSICSNGLHLAIAAMRPNNIYVAVIESKQTQIYIVPYIASESEVLGLGLGLDRIDYIKQFSL